MLLKLSVIVNSLKYKQQWMQYHINSQVAKSQFHFYKVGWVIIGCTLVSSYKNSTGNLYFPTCMEVLDVREHRGQKFNYFIYCRGQLFILNI